MINIYRDSSGVEHRDKPSEGGGSNPSPGTNSPLPRKWSIAWKQGLPCEDDIYVRRWVLETPWFSLRLHHWLHSDDQRALHDHPYAFVTCILRGGYTDVTFAGEQKMTPGMIVYRPATHAHYVRLDRGECWTLLFTSPIIRRWGFWMNGRWRKANKYFLSYGHHQCD